MSAATTTRSRTPDRQCAEAVEFARGAAVQAAGESAVGDHLGVDTDGDRVVTHFFATRERAYKGWRWAVTVTRAARSKQVTLDETVLLPGPDALVAPQWVPWSERLRPGDMGPGDLLPTESDDLRLEPGYSGEDEPAPNSVLAEDQLSGLAGEDVAVEPSGKETAVAPSNERAEIGAVAQELGMGRARVLSRLGLNLAADRWEKEYGAHTPMAQAAPASCATCGFLVPIAGSLSQAFGICSNEFGPADGRIVSLGYGCGGHSEAAVMPAPQVPAPPVLDELSLEPLPLHPDRAGGSVEESTPAEELGHS
ncbi:DUF3027 domain-containing protein [Streptacidiphilus fuscans]|uniref:DUF3027 domain-containing protein n=1 Tax=Streptacidiphilus fuscans TaxID=2789292 RepID=A0A931BAE6_9ACTN|nr:DUF3027 domain-containing protein [Streptacidiphilus fuscans]MBF9072175.1 DUF3027 domain-containing protein [Streptacidiphilus fuscans]MBF9072986.1 DUF3027 domain-containing protein [Streptacidiphilus fuscans]